MFVCIPSVISSPQIWYCFGLYLEQCFYFSWSTTFAQLHLHLHAFSAGCTRQYLSIYKSLSTFLRLHITSLCHHFLPCCQSITPDCGVTLFYKSSQSLTSCCGMHSYNNGLLEVSHIKFIRHYFMTKTLPNDALEVSTRLYIRQIINYLPRSFLFYLLLSKAP